MIILTNKVLNNEITLKSGTNINEPPYITLSKILWGMSPEAIKAIIFTAGLIILFVGQIKTKWRLNYKEDIKETPTINKNDFIRTNKQVIMKWIEYAVMDRKNDAINSDKVISENGKMELDRCIEIRNYLKSHLINGKKLLETVNGCTKLLVDKDELIDIISKA
jgi:hypothetical protein